MAEFLGLILFGAAFATLALVTPWFRRHEGARFIDVFMLGELTALLITALLIGGLAVLTDQIVTAWVQHDMVHVAVTGIAIIVGLPVLLYASRRLSRALARHAPAAPLPTA